MCQNFLINVANTPVYGDVAVSLASPFDGASVASTSWLLGIMLPEAGTTASWRLCSQFLWVYTPKWSWWIAWEFSS